MYIGFELQSFTVYTKRIKLLSLVFYERQPNGLRLVVYSLINKKSRGRCLIVNYLILFYSIFFFCSIQCSLHTRRNLIDETRQCLQKYLTDSDDARQTTNEQISYTLFTHGESFFLLLSVIIVNYNKPKFKCITETFWTF